MHNIISYYALTDRFREVVERSETGDVRYILASKLRSLKLLPLLGEIRKLKAAQITVAIENDDAAPLVGPLLLLAGLSGTSKIRILWPDHRREEVSRLRIVRLLAAIAVAQVSARLALQRVRWRGRRLAAPSRALPSSTPADKAILYLDANLSFGVAAGGSVGHIRGVIDGFVGQGFAVDYASVKPLASTAPEARRLPISPPALFAFPPEFNYYPFNLAYERRLVEQARHRHYDFLYQRMSLHNFSGAWLRQRLGLPLVLEYNGSETWVATHWGERLRLHADAENAEKLALRNADLVVVVSKALGDEVVAAGVPRERVVVYPNCIDPRIFDPGRFSPEDTVALRARHGIAADATVATFIGTFGIWHGVDFLARAIRRLALEQPDLLARHKLHFLLVGDGQKMPEVTQLLAGAPFAAHVTLTGLVPQAEAPAYLAASDIFLSPHLPNPDGSAFFGSPTKLFEYMAMEKPIVAADLDQIGEVLRSTDERGDVPLAELFVPGNETAFLGALQRVLDDRESAKAMAAHARASVLENYTWARHVSAILERMEALGLVGKDA